METVVQRKQAVPPERNHHGVLVIAENSRSPLFRASLLILDSLALAPSGNRLRIDSKLSAQLRDRSLRSLYASSDGVLGRGAAMTNYPIVLPSSPTKGSHHQTVGSNTER